MANNASSILSLVAVSNGDALSPSLDRRCDFLRTQRRWTLRSDCELATALDLPGDTTLDGSGYTISLVGDAEGFGGAGIRVSGGDVCNLTVDGSDLLPGAPAYFAAIALSGSGRVSHTIVQHVEFDETLHNAVGVEVASFDGAHPVVSDLTVKHISGSGLFITGNSQATADCVSCSDVTTAVQSLGTVVATLTQATSLETPVAVLAQENSRVRIVASNLSGQTIVEDRALIHQENVTFIGARDRGETRNLTADQAARHIPG